MAVFLVQVVAKLRWEDASDLSLINVGVMGIGSTLSNMFRFYSCYGKS